MDINISPHPVSLYLFYEFKKKGYEERVRAMRGNVSIERDKRKTTFKKKSIENQFLPS